MSVPVIRIVSGDWKTGDVCDTYRYFTGDSCGVGLCAFFCTGFWSERNLVGGANRLVFGRQCGTVLLQGSTTLQ